jgi:hypothetical protein
MEVNMQQLVESERGIPDGYRRGPYQLQVYRSASDIPQHCWGGIIDLLNEIIATNWRSDTPWWSPSDTPFREGYGIAFVRHDVQIVGFTIWRRLVVNDRPTVCRSGIELRPEHQGKGLFGLLLKGVLDAELSSVSEGEEIFYSWRTRNPVAWNAHAKVCTRLLPSLVDGNDDGSLQDVAFQIAKILYPDRALELPNLIIRNSYPNITYHRQPSYETNGALTEKFRRLVPDTADAIFTVGTIRQPAAAV